MTIGFAANGPHAGAAVQAAVLAAELLGRGAIGGFAVCAILDDNGQVRHGVTQNGGIAALALSQEWLQARHAAVISSGPDRPEPLVQFLPGANGVGLVTGHRLPNLPDHNGIPVNQAALARMVAGDTPQQAVDSVLESNPEADAGLIALDISGRLGWGNTARVMRRADRAGVHRDDGESRLALLHNSIYAQSRLADSVADLAWTALTGQRTLTRFLYMRQAVPIRTSDGDRVHITGNGVITSIDSANPLLARSHRRGTAIYLGSEVWSDGRQIGHVISELAVDIEDGKTCKPPDIPQIAIVMKENDHVAP